MSYLSGLNGPQQQAVTSASPNLLVLAGAGSGKTKVLTCRITYLIEKLGIKPWQILAVTFTNKAAREMRERTLLLSLEAEQSRLTTFHSFGAYFLRRNAAQLGLSPQFTIYDDGAAQSLLKRLYPDDNRIKYYYYLIEQVKNKALTFEDDWDNLDTLGNLKQIFSNYQAALTQNRAVDFGDLIYLPLLALQNDEVLRSQVRRRYKAILVDEYQDTNLSQAQLLRLLAGDDCFVTVVGDDDQSIYRFRGAEPANLFDFKTNFEPVELVKLEQNYRSTAHILACANAVINHNQGRLGKTLFTAEEGGQLPEVVNVIDAEDEVNFIAQKIKEDNNLAGTAILYRTNAQSRLFETIFTRLNIPYQLVGTLSFYEREEIKTALALLTLLLNPYDEDAFRRIINKPSRGLGAKSVAAVFAYRSESNGNLIEAALKALSALKGKVAAGLASFVTLIKELEELLAGELLSDFIKLALNKSGLAEYYGLEDESEGTNRLDNLNELVNAGRIYGRGLEGLTNFLDSTSLGSNQQDDDSPNKVTLITMHNTKGLEYDRVFVTGLENGLFPKADVHNADYEAELEEERRLFYVAITRARKELYFTYAKWRMLYGRTEAKSPSLFLSELPEAHIIGEKPPAEADNYAPNSFVRHEHYGFGKIINRAMREGHLVVEVKFMSGKIGKFLPQFTLLEQVSEEEIG
ncbi:MAG: ATP-dependent helicase [Spirochaetaceae bacterium]|nr:ATP-dependent helicase [Spirochaetaceae bacterium]